VLVNHACLGYNRFYMKVGIHPKYFDKAQVICVCGEKFTTGSTQEIIHVELCSKCHPFYTGEQRFVDAASRIQKFQTKQQKANDFKQVVTKKVEEKKKAEQGPKTLREMLMGMK
jgi:large subunit ribosomal protein L31